MIRNEYVASILRNQRDLTTQQVQQLDLFNINYFKQIKYLLIGHLLSYITSLFFNNKYHNFCTIAMSYQLDNQLKKSTVIFFVSSTSSSYLILIFCHIKIT